ncbi:hypothetical protein JCM16303_005573 [Sporobolomyces ruberrimus]
MDDSDFESFLTDSTPYDQSFLDPAAFLGLPQPFQDQERSPAPTTTSSTSSTPSIDFTAFSPDGSELGQETKKLRNCAACRMRRVKCEREAGQTSCIKCIAKGLVCTQLPSKPRKTPVRTGRRIETAQALFGQQEQDTTGDRLDSAQPPTKRRRGERTASVFSELSATSVISQLVTSELEASLTGSLLELYDTMDGRIPLFQATVFRPAFESSGRRLDRLDAKLEPLAAVVLALAARVSDHPLLVGASAPAASALSRAIKNGDDLSEWGKRRTDACGALLDRAMNVADRRGVWREATPENLATLMMIEGMTDYEKAHDPRNSNPSRPIGAAYMLHLRSILLDADLEKKQRIMGSGVGWTAFCRDSILSATAGITSVFSEDDCYLLSDDMPLPLDQALALPDFDEQNPTNPYAHPFRMLFNSVMFEIAKLGRTAAVKLTGLRAKRNPRINEEFVGHFILTLRKLNHAFDITYARLLRYVGPETSSIQEIKEVYSFVKHLRATKAGLAFLLDRVLKQRKLVKDSTVATEAAKIFQLEEHGQLNGPERSEDAEYWERFERLLNEASDLAFDAGRELVGIMAKHESLELGAISGMQMLFVRLPMWISRLIDAPTVEEGGSRPDWTFETKIADLRTTLRAVNRVGWAYASYAKPGPWLRSIIARIEARQQRYLLASGRTGSTISFSPLYSPFVASPTLSTPGTRQEGFASGLPWSGDQEFEFDLSPVPAEDDTDWETLLQSIVESTSASPDLARSELVEKEDKVLVEMFQDLLS